MDAPHRDDTEFRILALTGGGARGILQAVFLERLEEALGSPIGERFDLIAATSTGALAGLAIAAGKPAELLVELYRTRAVEIFEPRFLAGARRGPRYAQAPLRRVLEERFKELRIEDLHTDVLVCASGLDTFEGRVFTREDARMKLVDVALASSAAPTYFEPTVPAGEHRAYMDGGVWANDPSLVAVSHAIHKLRVAPERLRILTIGTGQRSSGLTARDVKKQRILSLRNLRFFLEFNGSLQAWLAKMMTAEHLAAEQIRRIDPTLPEWIALDDAATALAKLPGVAETEFEHAREDLVGWLNAPREPAPPPPPALSPTLAQGLEAGGVSAFLPSRAHYASLRDGRGTMRQYIEQAERTLTIVSVNLATALDVEQLQLTLEPLLRRDPPVQICISLVDPDEEHLMKTVAPHLSQAPELVAQRIRDALATLSTFRASLPDELAEALTLNRHRALPPSSAIIIDGDLPSGRIQLETKLYQTSVNESWAVEVRAGSDLYNVLLKSYDQLIRDGEPGAGGVPSEPSELSG